MEFLWGEFLPVPENKLSIIQDGDEIEINGRVIRAVDTPGHAYHHYAYIFGKLCFSGDVGGVRMQPTHHFARADAAAGIPARAVARKRR